jgi:flagellar hook-associated protein 2
VSGGDGSIRSLSDLGIRFQKDGSLSLDESKLTNALSQDSEAVQRLFLKAYDGVGKRIPEAVDSLISTVGGAITSRQNGLSESLTALNKKINREEQRISKYQEQLTAQFTALEKLVSQLNQQSNFLAQKLNTFTTTK